MQTNKKHTKNRKQMQVFNTYYDRFFWQIRSLSKTFDLYGFQICLLSANVMTSSMLFH